MILDNNIIYYIQYVHMNQNMEKKRKTNKDTYTIFFFLLYKLIYLIHVYNRFSTIFTLKNISSGFMCYAQRISTKTENEYQHTRILWLHTYIENIERQKKNQKKILYSLQFFFFCFFSIPHHISISELRQFFREEIVRQNNRKIVFFLRFMCRYSLYVTQRVRVFSISWKIGKAHTLKKNVLYYSPSYILFYLYVYNIAIFVVWSDVRIFCIVFTIFSGLLLVLWLQCGWDERK